MTSCPNRRFFGNESPRFTSKSPSSLSSFGQEDLINLEVIIKKAICFSCKIVYTFQDERDGNLLSLESDPSFSVFNLQNLAGIKTHISL